MAKRTIYLTHEDAAKLQEWLRISARHHDRDRANVDTLRRELEEARLIDGNDVHPDVVTMHSRVRLADEKGNPPMDYTLVFPDEAIPAQERISVLAPLGAAILGCRAGDVVRFDAPGGPQSVRILKVLYQPEASTSARRPRRRRAAQRGLREEVSR